MSIITMCDKDAPGAYLSEYWTKQVSYNPGQEIWLHKTHVGLVLSTGENNGYDDSDFYAIVWNTEKSAPERIVYASTRGWSYPNQATVDATEETLAAYRAYQDQKRQEEIVRQAQREAATPSKGKTVKVIKGRKVPLGTVGTVFWLGEQRDFGNFPRNGYVAHGRNMSALARSLGFSDVRDGKRVGIVTESGEKFFLNAMNVEVIAL